MHFTETALPGAYLIEIVPHEDERGFFARSWCRNEFAERGLETATAQFSISFNHRRGTVRGLHFQASPHEEVKIVRCTAGAMFDVIVDLRPLSPTFGQWTAVELTAANRRMIYIPKGIAHGFQTRADCTEVTYQMSEFFRPELARGVRYDDPDLAIPWPEEVTAISERDLAFPLLKHLCEF